MTCMACSGGGTWYLSLALCSASLAFSARACSALLAQPAALAVSRARCLDYACLRTCATRAHQCTTETHPRTRYSGNGQICY